MPAVSENVLEVVRQIREMGKEVSAAGMLFGNQSEEAILRKALAFGLDQACLISGATDRTDPHVKSKLIAKAIEKLGVPDILVVGGASGFGGGGQVGVRVAELLGFEDVWTVQDAVSAKSKSVLVVEQGSNQPRIPNVMAVMKAGSKEMVMFKAEEFLTADEQKPVALISREEWLA